MNESQSGNQHYCPVSAEPIDKQYYVDYKGSRIYFCSKTCPLAFKKDPERYMQRFRDQGVTLDKAPEAQPAGERQK